MERIGHYRIIEELGRGGMGVVYKGYEDSLARYVAIKVLGEHLSSDPQYVSRFLREAKAAARIAHPNIIQVYFVGEEQGRHFFAMEFVTGGSLEGALKKTGRIEPRRAARWILEAARGLAAAHEESLVHRDIKPANLLLDKEEHVKIADFGLALPLTNATRLTATGFFLGSPGYLSPEQCRGEDLDARTDVYSLGVTFYELLSGQMPFEGNSPAALVLDIVQSEPRPIEELNPSVDAELRRILARMMAKEREDRYTSTRALVAELEGYLGTFAAGAGAAAGASAPTRMLQDDDNAPAPTEIGQVKKESPPAPTVLTAQPEAPAPTVLAAQPEAPAATRLVDTGPAMAESEPAAMDTLPPAVVEASAAPAKAKGKAPYIAIAAVLLVLILVGGGAAAWMLGSRLGWFDHGNRQALLQQTADQLDDGSVNALTDASTSANAAADATTEPSEHNPAPSQAPAEASQLNASGSSDTPSPLPESGVESPPTEKPTPQTAGGGNGVAASAPVQTRRVPASTSSSSSHQPEATQPIAAPRRTAIVALGDPLLAGPVETYLEGALSVAGITTVDERGWPEVNDLLNGSPTVSGLVRALRGRASRLVVADIQYVGERQLNYMGRTSSVYQARVNLRAYDLTSGGGPTGRSVSQNVEYNQLTVDQAVDKALDKVADGFVNSLGGN